MTTTSGSPRGRSTPKAAPWGDVVIVLLVLALIVYVYGRVSDVLVYKWDWSFLPGFFLRFDEESGSWQANILLKGFLATIRLSILAMVIASIVGLVLGVMRTMKRLLPRMIASAYVGLIRNIPPLVFIFVFYFFISSQIMPLFGIDRWVRGLDGEQGWLFELLLGEPRLLENMISGVLCLAMFEAAYITEIVRAGIQAIPRGQIEAGESLGLSRFDVFRDVVLPQALLKVTPPLANQFIMLVKNSAIVALISVQELTFLGTEIAVSTRKPFETWITIAGMYFLLCYSLAWLFGRIERRSRRFER
ncbi:MAG: amino acid ABC transporter permease [Alphaproteobacteria bacterium]